MDAGWERERAMKTLRVLGLIVGKMELPLTSIRKTGWGVSWGLSGFGFGLVEFEMPIRHPYHHTFPILSQPHLPCLCNGRIIPALPNLKIEMLGWEFLRTAPED